MKTKLLAVLIGLGLLMACDNEDDNGTNNNGKVTEVQTSASNGQWRITSFVDSGSDETSHFNGYIFEFDDNNILTATNGSNNYSGTWAVTDDDSSDDDNNNDFDDIDFNISFNSPPAFEELTEDWEIISLSDNMIELRHVSGGNGGTDTLIFSKV